MTMRTAVAICLICLIYVAGWLLTSARIWNISDCIKRPTISYCWKFEKGKYPDACNEPRQQSCGADAFIGGMWWPVYWSWKGALIVTKQE